MSRADGRLIPVIDFKNCSSRAGSAYSGPNKSSPPPFASFCGSPVLSPSVNDPQNPYNRAFTISMNPPTYPARPFTRNCSPAGVLSPQ